ncbi:RNA-binding protein 28-like [Patiria miniata]|uniref:RRM domain-containing protein n=1 Tax=Patiria miniata TaxID=46514 RepID=A0A913ZBN9_PATMI|nr:RNA-binding protein 28-like [Patiria miniata]
MKTKLSLGKRKLFLSYSRKKAPRKKEKATAEQDEEDKVDKSPPERRLGSAKLDRKQGTVKGEAKDKEGRLIIRNLAFSCSEERLAKAFARFGDITEVHIPSDPTDPSKVRGYGFVQFDSLDSASKAVKEMNAKKIMGRPIAVDWSLSRDRYLAAAKTVPAGKQKPKDTDEEEKSDDEEDDESDDESGVESSSEVEETRDDDEDDSDDSPDSDDDDDEEEMEEDTSSEDEGMASNEDGKRKRTHKNTEQESNIAKRKKLSNDVGEGRTVFIRNILFETTEEEIHEFFSEFGQIMYCKLVVDKATEHSKGTAFVQFATTENAERCLEKASKEGDEGLVLGGRQLLVSLALPREQASKLREVKKEKQKILKKDKRNMYLLQEGFIRPGTSAAQGMTDADIAKRTKLESVKRLKLKNINIFVSPTRLAIHNLPKAVDGKKLNQALLIAAGDKKAKVIESRVMVDMKSPNAEGRGKSLGFAFAEFTKHEHALAALRKMNNSTEFFGGSKRPIVGFSLENRQALEAKQRRKERSLLKTRQIQSMQKPKDNKSKQKDGESQQPTPKSKPQPKTKKGVLPPPPSTKLEKRMQSKSKMTVHVGAKKRWRDRGKEQEAQKEKRKMRRRQLLGEVGRKQRESAKPRAKKLQAEDGTQKSRRQKGSSEDAKFDKLVANYKQKLFSRETAGQTLKKSKWFDES